MNMVNTGDETPVRILKRGKNALGSHISAHQLKKTRSTKGSGKILQCVLFQWKERRILWFIITETGEKGQTRCHLSQPPNERARREEWTERGRVTRP